MELMDGFEPYLFRRGPRHDGFVVKGHRLDLGGGTRCTGSTHGKRGRRRRQRRRGSRDFAGTPQHPRGFRATAVAVGVVGIVEMLNALAHQFPV